MARDSSEHFVVMIVNDHHHGSTGEPKRRLYYMNGYTSGRDKANHVTE